MIISDLPDFIPLINMNIEVNKDLITGNTMAKALTWGEDTISEQNFDYVVLADCIYYEQVFSNYCYSLHRFFGEVHVSHLFSFLCCVFCFFVFILCLLLMLPVQFSLKCLINNWTFSSETKLVHSLAIL